MHIAHQVVGVKRGHAKVAPVLSLRPADLSDEDIVDLDTDIEAIDDDETVIYEQWYPMDSDCDYEV